MGPSDDDYRSWYHIKKLVDLDLLIESTHEGDVMVLYMDVFGKSFSFFVFSE